LFDDHSRQALQFFNRLSSHVRIRKLAISVLACLLISGVGIAFFGQQREPSFKGRKLSQWVTDYGKGQFDKLRDWEAEEAIQHIGVAAIPFLMHWMENEEPSIFARGVSAIGKQFSDDPDWDLAYLNQHRAESAVMAFSALGSEARAVIPGMTQRMVTSNDEYRGSQAAKVLANIGVAALPELLGSLTNENHAIRKRAAFALFCMADTNSLSATGALIQAIDDPDSSVMAYACLTLSRQTAALSVVIPILSKMLTDEIPNRRVIAEEALTQYGSVAVSTRR
jgi:HEAT repeat protein